jgi:hypothetical protein
VQKGTKLKHATTAEKGTGVSVQTKLLGAIKNPKAKPKLKEVQKPKEGTFEQCFSE